MIMPGARQRRQRPAGDGSRALLDSSSQGSQDLDIEIVASEMLELILRRQISESASWRVWPWRTVGQEQLVELMTCTPVAVRPGI